MHAFCAIISHQTTRKQRLLVVDGTERHQGWMKEVRESFVRILPTNQIHNFYTVHDSYNLLHIVRHQNKLEKKNIMECRQILVFKIWLNYSYLQNPRRCDFFLKCAPLFAIIGRITPLWYQCGVYVRRRLPSAVFIGGYFILLIILNSSSAHPRANKTYIAIVEVFKWRRRRD